MIDCFAAPGVHSQSGFSSNRRRRQGMRSIRTQQIRLALGFLLAAIAYALPSPSHAAWVNPTAGQFNVGNPTMFGSQPQLNLTNAGNPVCTSTKGGTSLAVIQGFRAGVDPVQFPVVL